MNKKIKIITSMVCLLPLTMSVMVYKQIPEQMAVHWDSMGQPNGHIHKAAGAFGLPFLMLVIHLCTMYGLGRDTKKSSHSTVSRIIGIWAVPTASIFLIPVTLLTSIGYNIQITKIVTIAVGLLLLICGNYLPKSRINNSMGFRLPWTLKDDNNWYKTHRIAGFLWILGGMLLIVYGFFQTDKTSALLFVVLLIFLMGIIPIFYSFISYRKKART